MGTGGGHWGGVIGNGDWDCGGGEGGKRVMEGWGVTPRGPARPPPAPTDAAAPPPPSLRRHTGTGSARGPDAEVASAPPLPASAGSGSGQRWRLRSWRRCRSWWCCGSWSCCRCGIGCGRPGGAQAGTGRLSRGPAELLPVYPVLGLLPPLLPASRPYLPPRAAHTPRAPFSLFPVSRCPGHHRLFPLFLSAPH